MELLMSHSWPGSHQWDGKVATCVACGNVVIVDLLKLLSSKSFCFLCKFYASLCLCFLSWFQTTNYYSWLQTTDDSKDFVPYLCLLKSNSCNSLACMLFLCVNSSVIFSFELSWSNSAVLCGIGLYIRDSWGSLNRILDCILSTCKPNMMIAVALFPIPPPHAPAIIL